MDFSRPIEEVHVVCPNECQGYTTVALFYKGAGTQYSGPLPCPKCGKTFRITYKNNAFFTEWNDEQSK